MIMKTVFIGGLIAAFLAAGAAQADQCGPARGQPGSFDYYLMSLSWAPSYCATTSGRANAQECGPGTSYGFVVHGLWPQYASGQWPQCCQAVAAVKPSAVLDRLSRVMIGSSLISHEWEKHGSCVTSQQDEYFGKIDQVVTALGLAPQVPGTGLDRIKVSALKQNWAVPAQSITVQCKGRKLTEVRICLDKTLSPMPCPAKEVESDNCPGTVSLH
ncbi:Ribonuclease I [Paramagnetospirillum magneticum AMB-1]|uniref:Ribonuclease I n=2 Tax=Paramagnetospirillum magneticum TaxID=84159 RepID=Q2W3S1_PARM1|nr:Ribonuclease I [Paramagnetospirillum magneticum AMB-1]